MMYIYHRGTGTYIAMEECEIWDMAEFFDEELLPEKQEGNRIVATGVQV